MFTHRLLHSTFSSTRIALLPCVRSIHHSLPPPLIPSATKAIPDVPTFLKRIGRNTIQHEPKFTSWEQFFALTSTQMRELGIEPTRNRRYILHWREAFRMANGELKLKEHKRGKKIDGGERRQKEVRAKRRAEENKDRRAAAESEKEEKEKAYV
ncbi:telomere length regulation protein [Maublancomyces gigas]|uniref:Small ribosomal subunit protein mS41 n=1 Tax=Discina gigas TaxID=1032678 RepID=A0ABR3GBX9_9PEZI